MLLRIVVDESAGAAALRIHGRLGWDGVDELRRAFAGCRGAVELDLGDLREADAVGVAFLQGLVQAGARIQRSNPYVTALLRPPGRPGPAA